MSQSAEHVVHLASAPRPRRRSLAPLTRLLDQRLRGRLGPVLAKLFAVAVSVGTAAAMPFVARSSGGDGSAGLALSALGWLSFVAGGAIALSAAGPGAREEEAALAALARARGHSVRSFGLADVLATARRIRRVVGVPALLLAGLSFAFARSLRALGGRTLLLGTVAIYVLVLSSLLALLAHVSRRVSPERGRSLFVALVLLPHVIHLIVPEVPSVLSVLAALLAHLPAGGLG